MKIGQMFKMRPAAMATLLALPALGATAVAHAEVTGNISVVSQYVLRGITTAPENTGAALQGGLDYGHDSGFYAGYWASSLGYGDDTGAMGVENDVYAGFAGEAGSVSYDVGAVYYAYLNAGDDLDAGEIYGGIGVGPFSVKANYLAQDVAWGNQGDIYWRVGYETDLPGDFSLGATLGYYTYSKDGKFISDSPAAESAAFRHLDLTLSHPLGDSGADMSLTAIVGGKDRFGTSQENTLVLGVSYGF